MRDQPDRAIAQEQEGTIMTSIVRCTCKNSAQDEMYGVGNRVANELRNGQLRCTVCSTIHGSTSVTRPTQADKIVEKQKEEPKKEDKKSKPKPNKDKKFGRK